MKACGLATKSDVRRSRLGDERGFTILEVLFVVGVLVILMSFATVNFLQSRRTLSQTELDGVAKQIYVAAQNHLTMAKSQNLIDGRTDQGHDATSDYDKKDGASLGIMYFVYPLDDPGEATLGYESDSVFNLMLPYGSLDEHVRKGSGWYLVRYQPSTGTVLDVFYNDGGSFSYSFDTSNPGTEYVNLMAVSDRDGSDHRTNRANYNGSVIGYYNGSDVETYDKTLEAPTVTIDNAEQLKISVKNPNMNGTEATAEIKLLITGATSKASATFTLVKEAVDDAGNVTYSVSHLIDSSSCKYYTFVNAKDNINHAEFTIVLDDITQAKGHFADRIALADEEPTGFIPGENLRIQAVAQSSQYLANVAYSPMQTTNSLFGASRKTTSGSDTKVTANITNIRHLQNLDPNISSVSTSNVSVAVTNARQITNLSWPGFLTDIRDANSLDADDGVQIYNSSNTPCTDANEFWPIKINQAIAYDGRRHKISGVNMIMASNAGLFSELSAGSEITNLKLANFDIVSTNSNAGALAGSAEDVTLSNVVVVEESTKTAAYAIKATGTNGAAGGLVGELKESDTGTSAIDHCAAAVYVSSSSGNAGGLIGTVDGSAEITACYSGGHTSGGSYDSTSYNVTASAAAGGLVGDADDAVITSSYSTCSAKGATVGGFVGSASGTITNCYSTGLVATTATTVTEDALKTVGAFAGTLTAGTLTGTVDDCQYYECINLMPEITGATTTESTYLLPVSNAANAEVTAFDTNTSTYKAFIPDAPDSARPYDSTLITNYQETYYLMSVDQLAKTLDPSDSSAEDTFVMTHYGDWPSPEVMVVNTK